MLPHRYSLRILGLTLLLYLPSEADAQNPCNPQKLPLQLADLAIQRPIDNSCPCRGAEKGQPGSAINQANAVQNLIKSNFSSPAEHATTITVRDMIRLQDKVDDIPFNLLPRGDRFTLPSQSQRARLQNIKIGVNKTFSEGQVVALVGFVIGRRHSNLSGGESVNCEQDGCANNDIHIEVTASPLEPNEDKGDKMNDEGVVAEISPRHRPTSWDLFDSPSYTPLFRDHPVMFVGQLFYDASHHPGGGPDRASVWEIHPVYAIFVCNNTALSSCRTDMNVWVPFHKAHQVFSQVKSPITQTVKCQNNP